MVVQIGSTYVLYQPKAPKVFYDYGEDVYFSRECPRCQLVSPLGITYVSHWVRVLGNCYDYGETSHWYKECPRCLIIIHLSYPNQSYRVVASLVRGSAFSTSLVVQTFRFILFGNIRL